MNIMGYEIFTDELETIDLKIKKVINTINPHSYVTAKSDKLFQEALHQSDILIPDGRGIVLAASQINKKTIKKIAGADLHKFLLSKMNDGNAKVFYMGASQNTLNKIEKKIKKEYPNITVDSFSPPFKDEFSKDENQEIIDKINIFNPNVLFVGMTAPKQEKWLHVNKNKLNFKVASSIGAVFDFYAGNTTRAPQWMIDFGMEWLHRSLKSRRLFIRNFKSNPIFLIDMMKEKIK